MKERHEPTLLEACENLRQALHDLFDVFVAPVVPYLECICNTLARWIKKVQP